MRQIVREYRKHPDIYRLSRYIVATVPPKRWAGEAIAIRNFVRRNIRFTRDIRDVETLTNPVRLLEIRQGDCDDHAMLVASLLESIGHPTRFTAIGVSPFGGFSHVYAETKIGEKWYPVETTENYSFGRMIPHARRLVVHT